MKHITAMVKDAVTAAGVSIHDTNRYRATVARTTRALRTLVEEAALRGLDEQVISGYFKLSAYEPQRLPKLVDSIIMLRLPEVAMALMAYDKQH